MRPINPYESPSTSGPTTSVGCYTMGAVIAALLVVPLGLLATYFRGIAHQLTVDYPDLYDGSPNVDFYWPSLSHSIHIALAILTAMGALFCAGVAVCVVVVQQINRAASAVDESTESDDV